jgi:hypothetical protein
MSKCLIGHEVWISASESADAITPVHGRQAQEASVGETHLWDVCLDDLFLVR